ncbi:MAG TPA: hypothetical protein VMM18_18470 [Gemmatimonadaceae bacterium]|nr:hypothetical protein [Gemmatimonadaceae bacterium]
MSMQSERTIQELRTPLPASEVLARAKRFFMERSNLYAAFLEKDGPTYAAFRGQGGEELIIGATPAASGGTLVTGSTYLFDMQVARFLSTLPAMVDGEGVAAPVAPPSPPEGAS